MKPADLNLTDEETQQFVEASRHIFGMPEDLPPDSQEQFVDEADYKDLPEAEQ